MNEDVKPEDEHLRAIQAIGAPRLGQTPPETLQTILRDFQSVKDRLERWMQDHKRNIG